MSQLIQNKNKLIDTTRITPPTPTTHSSSLYMRALLPRALNQNLFLFKYAKNYLHFYILYFESWITCTESKNLGRVHFSIEKYILDYCWFSFPRAGISLLIFWYQNAEIIPIRDIWVETHNSRQHRRTHTFSIKAKPTFTILTLKRWNFSIWFPFVW